MQKLQPFLVEAQALRSNLKVRGYDESSFDRTSSCFCPNN
jgi:hypothetical protein